MKTIQKFLQEQALPVDVKEKIVVDKEWYCPHCKEKIGEKATYYDGAKWFHRACKGEIILP